MIHFCNQKHTSREGSLLKRKFIASPLSTNLSCLKARNNWDVSQSIWNFNETNHTDKTQTWKNKRLTFTSPFFNNQTLHHSYQQKLPPQKSSSVCRPFFPVSFKRRLHAYVAESKRVATRRCWFITAKSLRTRDLSPEEGDDCLVKVTLLPKSQEKHCKK